MTNNMPNNVDNSVRFFRKLNPAVVARYEGAMSDFGDSVANRVAMANPMRPSFGHTCLGEDRGDRYIPGHHPIRWHTGSHGAMGGVGYQWVIEDEACQKAIGGELAFWAKEVLGLDARLEAAWDPDIGLQPLSPYVGGVLRKRPGTR